MKENKAMERNFALILASAQATTAQAKVVDASIMTNDRLWAIIAIGLALVGAVIGGVALARAAGSSKWRIGASLSLLAGLVGGAVGGLLLATADAGPGSGNGVVGAGAALVLGLLAIALSGMALVRSRRLLKS
jgi:peptidoglycan/LPS O-acetylase OafA/YrhL